MPEALRLRPRAIAKEIQTLFAEGRQPSFTEVDIGSWNRALDILIDQNDYRAARFGAGLLLARHPELKAMEVLCRLIDVTPVAGDMSTEHFDPRKAVQTFQREGADTVVLVFAGRFWSVGISFGLARRWFGRLDASVTYLNDFSHRFFLAGLRSIADNRAATVAELKKRIAATGARRIVCYGNDIAGFAAVLYAIELGADAVVWMDGATSIGANRERQAHRLASADAPTSLAKALAGVARPPQILIVSGEGRPAGQVDPDAIAHLPSVTLRLVERHKGPGAAEIVCRGQFERVLDWMMTSTPETPRDVGAFKYYPWRESFA